MKKSKASKEATIDITSPEPVVLGDASSSVTLQQVDPLNPPKLRKSSRLQSDKSDTESLGSSPQVKIIEPVPSKTTSKSSSSYIPPSAEELRERIDPITCLEKLRELLKNNPPSSLPQEAEGYQGYSTDTEPFTELQIKTTWNGFHLHPSARDVTRAISKLPDIYQPPRGKKKSRNPYFTVAEPEPEKLVGLNSTAKALLLANNRCADLLENHMCSVYGRKIISVRNEASNCLLAAWCCQIDNCPPAYEYKYLRRLMVLYFIEHLEQFLDRFTPLFEELEISVADYCYEMVKDSCYMDHLSCILLRQLTKVPFVVVSPGTVFRRNTETMIQWNTGYPIVFDEEDKTIDLFQHQVVVVYNSIHHFTGTTKATERFQHNKMVGVCSSLMKSMDNCLSTVSVDSINLSKQLTNLRQCLKITTDMFGAWAAGAPLTTTPQSPAALGPPALFPGGIGTDTGVPNPVVQSSSQDATATQSTAPAEPCGAEGLAGNLIQPPSLPAPVPFTPGQQPPSRNVRRGRGDPESKVCLVCDLTFSRTNLKQDHDITVHGEGYKCSVCGKEGFSSSQSLKTHKASQHGIGTIKTYKCTFGTCQWTSYKKSALDAHKINHGVKANYQCPNCSKYYATTDSLRKHKKTCGLKAQARLVGQKPLKCPHCKWTFIHEDGLNRHIIQRHGAGMAQYKCPICDQQLSNKKALENHLERHPVASGEAEEGGVEEVQEEAADAGALQPDEEIEPEAGGGMEAEDDQTAD